MVNFRRARNLLQNDSMSGMTEESRTFRVLVVDGNEAAAHGLGALLKHYNHEVDYAFRGADVAPTVAVFNPDVIVLDIGLPDISGYDVAKDLRRTGFRGRLIALTGFGGEDDKAKAAEVGFDSHLTKPIGIAEVLASLVPLAT